MSRWDFMLVVPRDEEDRAHSIMLDFEDRDSTFYFELDHRYEGVVRIFFASLFTNIFDVVNVFHTDKLTILN